MKNAANLPLHTGKCPSWLFSRMKPLAKSICNIIVNEYGSKNLLEKLSDPYWFQSFSCVIGFDWHSSGTTTTACGVLKEIDLESKGVFVCGGKGKASRKTPKEIIKNNGGKNLVKASKLSAKIDSSLIQDNYNLYHHTFVFDENNNWAVIQQGMNTKNKYARRYHWFNENIERLIGEKEKVACDNKHKNVLNLISNNSKENRKISLDLVKDNPKHLEKYTKTKNYKLSSFTKELSMNPNHEIIKNVDISVRSLKSLKKAYEIQPDNFQELLGVKGVGQKTIRALSLISELIYGKEADWSDPVKYSYAHGGKDGFPYPVAKKRMSKTTQILKDGIKQANLKRKDRLNALKRLSKVQKTSNSTLT